ncbi:MAG: alpha-amylase, partial [Chloroflexota bacterium]|nr:alpha-amylase [Chloroflexota bacterium]
MELHVSRAARERYGLDPAALPSPAPDGTEPARTLRSDLTAARQVAARINRHRQATDAVGPGQVYALGLIDEILRVVVALYRRDHGPDVFADALRFLEDKLGRQAVESALRALADAFPTADGYASGVGADAYLSSSTAGRSNRELALERLLHVWLANANPAFAPFRDLFNDEPLRDTAYPQIVAALQVYFDARPPFGPDWQPLVTMLRSPAVAVPDSLAGQLRYIRERWGA